ncbi:MAG: hypothetical protein FWE92_05715 [Defluviitaleaceae bacterium]|nr:hypothetical protein [Defluviitaleaceae bacterium]
MPFNSETAAAAGRKSVKAKKDPDKIRNKTLLIAVSEKERDMIKEKAQAEKISNTELIVRAVSEYK